MDHLNLTSALQIAQLSVAVMTLISVAFYLGRHSRKVEENTEDIKEIKADYRLTNIRLSRHDVEFALMGRDAQIKEEA